MNQMPQTRLSASELTGEMLLGAAVFGADDVPVGSVGGVQGTGSDTRVVVEVGGFLGIGAKPVALKAAEFDFLRDTRGRVQVRTAWSKRALKGLPEYRPIYRSVGHSAI